MILGVENSKYHSNKRVTAQERHILSQSSEVTEFEKRETIYDRHREALSVEIRLEFCFTQKELNFV